MKVNIEVQRKGPFGIPYKTTQEKYIMVDGKTYRRMKKEEQTRLKEVGLSDDEILTCAAVVWEEEMAELFGE